MLDIFVSQMIKIPIKAITFPVLMPQNGKVQGVNTFSPKRVRVLLTTSPPKGQGGKWKVYFKLYPLFSGEYTVY